MTLSDNIPRQSLQITSIIMSVLYVVLYSILTDYHLTGKTSNKLLNHL